MNVKIQGGNKAYANKGSCYGVANYLEHEDFKQLKDKKMLEPFFNQTAIDLNKKHIVDAIDKNKAKLGKNDAKFYVLTISPSKDEISSMGNTPKEQSENFKRFIREQIMPTYAHSFNKGLTENDLLYFAKIHHTRNNSDDREMHAHIVVSRKTIDNKLKISPNTNHKEGSTGIIKSGFNRVAFFQNIEEKFDHYFSFKRSLNNSFDYLNTMKNGSIDDLKSLVDSTNTPLIKQAPLDKQLEPEIKETKKSKSLKF